MLRINLLKWDPQRNRRHYGMPFQTKRKGVWLRMDLVEGCPCEFCEGNLVTRVRLRRVIKGYCTKKMWENRT